MVQVSTSREKAKFWHNFALLLFSNKCIENWKANQGYIIPHFKKIFKSIYIEKDIPLINCNVHRLIKHCIEMILSS